MYRLQLYAFTTLKNIYSIWSVVLTHNTSVNAGLLFIWGAGGDTSAQDQQSTFNAVKLNLRLRHWDLLDPGFYLDPYQIVLTQRRRPLKHGWFLSFSFNQMMRNVQSHNVKQSKKKLLDLRQKTVWSTRWGLPPVCHPANKPTSQQTDTGENVSSWVEVIIPRDVLKLNWWHFSHHLFSWRCISVYVSFI